jgi:glycosyltransferase involved in cell wall biosynthesis
VRGDSLPCSNKLQPGLRRGERANMSRLHVIQIGFFVPPAQEHPRELLEKWRLLEIPDALGKRGVQVTALLSNENPYMHRNETVSVEFISESRWCKRISSGFFPPMNLVKRACELQPDVLHVHGLHHASQLLYLRARLPKIPILVQDHANRPPTSSLRRRFHQRSLRDVEAVSFTDLALADEFLRAGILSETTKRKRVQEGSSLFEIGDQGEAQERTGIHGSPACLWVGDLNENKDPMTALAGFRIALKDIPEAKLWMCFRQSRLRQSVDEYLESHPALKASVVLLGAKAYSEMENLHRAADVYLSASHREGGAYSVIEALACGSYPLVTRAAVFCRLTADGRFGAHFDAGDAAELSRQLIALKETLSPELRRRLRAHFEHSLSNEAIAVSLCEVYEGILAS